MGLCTLLLNYRFHFFQRDSISYTLAVTRIPPAEEKSPLRSFFKSIVDLFDFSLLLSPSFDLLLLSGFLTMVGYFTPFSYVKGTKGKGPRQQLVIGLTKT